MTACDVKEVKERPKPTLPEIDPTVPGNDRFGDCDGVSREFKVFHGTHGLDCRMLETAAFEFGDSNRRRLQPPPTVLSLAV